MRIERMVEYVEMARQFFTGADLDYRGEHVTAVDMQAVPAAVQLGGPRIMIGGGGPRVLGVAGRLADIVSINFNNASGKIGADGVGSGTAAGTADKIEWIKAGAGDRFDQIELEIAAYFTTVTDDGAAATQAMATGLGLAADELALHPHALIGSVEHIVEAMLERRERYGISYVTVGAKVLEDFAPVVAALAGN
ncbi:MAG: LLM class flavin-dependent oxidoreductase [Acidimicrobiales bacterium]|nr:LLM class flavin-dependent oxidoreductase [Acidimicrobiales bacterium]